jgi:vacuolar-type H+-ATPase subunit I/STV1
MHGPAALQALGLVRFADDPGAQGTAPAEQAPAPAGESAGGDGEHGGEQQTAKALADLGEDWQMSDLPEPVQEYIRSVRAEAKKDRTTQQENAAQKARDEQLQKVAVALGLADEKPTEETLNETISGLTTDLAAAQERVAQFERRDAITTAADAVKVNAQAALALKDTDAALADVDLNDSKAVQDALLKVADQHPHIKVASTVDQSGGDFQNGSGRKPSDPKDLHAAVGSYYQ